MKIQWNNFENTENGEVYEFQIKNGKNEKKME